MDTLAANRARDYTERMDTPIPTQTADTTRPETKAERQERMAWEAEGIAKALASAAAGRVVDEAEVDAWIDSIGTDHELPVPYSDR